nr:hypothetical protein [Tanacetum cinerariifolium]
MNDKMNDPECVTLKLKIAPHDYSKENLLATFTPQKQLTPEQIFWSNDLMKLKSKALKERTKVSRPIKAFTVIGNNPPTPDKDTLDFDSVFVIGKMQASLQRKDNAIRQLKKQLSKLQVTSSDTEQEAKVVRPLDRSIVYACRYTKHSQELLEYAIGTCPQGSQQRAKQLAHTPLIRKKQVTTTKPFDRQDSNKHKHVVTHKNSEDECPCASLYRSNKLPQS